MNVLEYEMIEILKKLKSEYGVFEIKAEYENEGSVSLKTKLRNKFRTWEDTCNDYGERIIK